MAGNTPELNLYLPGGGSTGLYLPDEVADIDRLNENSVKIDNAFIADRARLTSLEATRTGRIVVPTGVTVTGGGSGGIDSATGMVTLSGVCTQFRVDGAFPEEGVEYEMLMWFEGVTGADATTDLFIGLADGATPRTNLAGRVTDYPAGAPATVTPSAATNINIVENSVANASPAAVRLLVTNAKEATKGTRARFEVDFASGAGRRDGVIANATPQSDPTLRVGFTGTGSTIVAGTKLLIRKVIP